MTEKKPRKSIVDVHIEEGDSVEGVWDEKRQTLALKVVRGGQNISAKKVQLTTLYERPKKPKFLNQTEFDRSSDFSLDENSILQKYAQVWAIDTNKKEIFDHIANVSAVTACNPNAPLEYQPVLAIIFGLTKNNPELYGWRRFIEFVQSTSQYDPECRYALIVDSELSNISDFNAQKIPVHGPFFLPSNWDLIYATSDSGKEYVFNRLVAEADKVSSEILRLISSKPSNVKYWQHILDEEQHQPCFLQLAKRVTSPEKE